MVFFLPIHVVCFSSDQIILVGLSSLCISFLSYLYHNHSLSINLYCFGSIYLLSLIFLSSLFRMVSCRQEFDILAPLPKVAKRGSNRLTVQGSCTTCGLAIEDKNATMLVHL